MQGHFQKSTFLPRRNMAPLSNHGFSKSTIERLSMPKAKNPGWLPDRPSVYWLDYLIDPTPHKIKDPEKLAGYYDQFEPKFPRTRNLATPRKYYGTLYKDPDWENRISMNSGIPLSALSYKPTSRIRDLATPKPVTPFTVSDFDIPQWARIGTGRSSKRSLPTGRSRSPRNRQPRPFVEPNIDLARGDYPTRSKHEMLSKENERSASAGKNSKSRSRPRNNSTGNKIWK